MNSWKRTLQWITTLALVCCMSGAAFATIGNATLAVAGANTTPTHFDIPLEVATTATLCGVSTSEVGDPLPTTITVWVKSSELGNTMLTATRIGVTDCYEFSYTPPFWACGTTIVAYQRLGLDANNDVAMDGSLDGVWTGASGLRFVDEFGYPIECIIPIRERSWGAVKQLFR